MTRFGAWKMAAVLLFSATTVIASPAQGFNTLLVFDATNGANPVDGFIQGADGNLYATTTRGGGKCDCGTVFQMETGGFVRHLNFDQTNGALPFGSLLQTPNGIFYGTTEVGGKDGLGTVFQVKRGELTTLHTFIDSDGAYPGAGLVRATDGNLYGTTGAGGDLTCNSGYGCGVVFKMTAGGNLTTIHIFEGSDGDTPVGGVIQGTDGNFYGTTERGGVNNWGTLFRMTLGGKLTTLYSFCGQIDCADGLEPSAGLVQGADGNFYGTTSGGGLSTDCGGGGCGTVFKMTPEGQLTLLHSFNNADGAYPNAGLIQATDGNFYGTTAEGGPNICRSGSCGTVFSMTPDGILTTVHDFDGSDGANPVGILMQDTSGLFYGTTSEGSFYKGTCSQEGQSGCGTIFTFGAPGAGPFVEMQSGFGKVGAATIILGTSLTGTTSVSFNGTAATFSVVSASEIKAKIPPGATTGYVTVTTPSGTLTSNVPFRVIP